MKLAIGIDTGGTYTDAVLYDFENGKIIGTAKSLTTRENLCSGISDVLDKLPQTSFSEVRMVALSTTLATNACVEGRGGKAKLIFFGGDRTILKKYGAEYGLPAVDEIYLPECKTELDGSIALEPNWEEFGKTIEKNYQNLDGIGVIELYAAKNNACIEKKAKETIGRVSSVPVTCGYELFRGLNSLQRGASALLNAQLYPVVREFMDAVKSALLLRGVTAPVVVMRSDGSLMSESFARLHPVETLLCGPAASVVGGYTLTGQKNSVVVDMGGTTTDVAIIENGLPVRTQDGVKVGKWKTFVNGMLVRTFGLGGDSAVHYRGGRLVLEEYRVIPLCAAGKKFPQMKERLKEIIDSEKIKHTHFRHEFYILVKDIAEDSRYSERERALCSALKNGPLILDDAAAACGTDVYSFDASRLIKFGAVQICGLTPTDIMHIKGDFCAFDCEISRLAAEIVAANLGCDVKKLCEDVYEAVEKKMYFNIAELLLWHRDDFYKNNPVGRETHHLIEESYKAAASGAKRILEGVFSTEYTFIGIGAPTRLFLKRVAELFGAKAVVPDHSEVANAVGAVTGNVYAACTAEVKPAYTAECMNGFIVYGSGAARSFEKLEDACSFAEDGVRRAAEEKAREQGAEGYVEVTVGRKYTSTEINGGTDADKGSIFLGVVVTAEAVGSIGLK